MNSQNTMHNHAAKHYINAWEMVTYHIYTVSWSNYGSKAHNVLPGTLYVWSCADVDMTLGVKDCYL